ncbi:MAG: carbon-nitrogen hydrolase family protein [Vicinamibacteria bacterium]
MTRKVSVGGVQMERSFGDKAYNLRQGCEAIRRAAGAGAEVVALPELFSTGYFPGGGHVDDRYFDWAEPVPGPTTDAIHELAGDLGVSVVAPLFERDPLNQLFYNSAVVLGPEGVLGCYRKRHIPSTANALEKHYFSVGNLGYGVFETPRARIGVSICYDRHFPETFRHLALSGAEVVFSVNNTSSPRSKRMWNPEIQVACSSSGIFIVQVNAVGEVPAFFGRSFACSPLGEVLTELAEGEEGVLVREIDLQQIPEARAQYGSIHDTNREDLGLSEA